MKDIRQVYVNEVLFVMQFGIPFETIIYLKLKHSSLYTHQEMLVKGLVLDTMTYYYFTFSFCFTMVRFLMVY